MKKQTTISLSIILLIIGCCILITSKQKHTALIPAVKHPAAKTIKKEFAQTEVQINQQLEMLQKRNHSKEKQLASVKEKLQTARTKNKTLLHKIEAIATDDNKDSSATLQADILIDIDRPKENDNKKDSLCNQALAIQEERLAYKDSALEIASRQKMHTSVLLNNALNAQAYQHKQLKKEKRKATVWKMAAAVTTTLFLLKR